MRKFWKELQYFWRQVRYGYHRQNCEDTFQRATYKLLSLELKPYTYIECLTVAVTSFAPYQDQGGIAGMLFARSNRGKTDIEVARKILREGYV